ncbi:hypothetical protein N7481_005432 [Penicillium waksmanii]|uniref:uncharacterized protein n=1 Tax=Penicillium waksmanii TaxID=69791 RepID=UPI0025484083|nr:uncharacterized protein N7481_005432 [Penicillium waksmanii]KAJ5983333.1 hypothetical protein N7481_005432 [Penicillium waksmanii]
MPGKPKVGHQLPQKETISELYAKNKSRHDDLHILAPRLNFAAGPSLATLPQLVIVGDSGMDLAALQGDETS